MTFPFSIAALLLGAAQVTGQAPPADERFAIEAAIAAYNDALTGGDVVKFRESLAGQIFMFNGAFSSDPMAWEAHMYVPPERIAQWTENFVVGAGPHFNSYKVVSVNSRANGAVVTTEDTGRNKYLNWEKMRVTWLVGKGANGWKVTGFFIRDIANPK